MENIETLLIVETPAGQLLAVPVESFLAKT